MSVVNEAILPLMQKIQCGSISEQLAEPDQACRAVLVSTTFSERHTMLDMCLVLPLDMFLSLSESLSIEDNARLFCWVNYVWVSKALRNKKPSEPEMCEREMFVEKMKRHYRLQHGEFMRHLNDLIWSRQNSKHMSKTDRNRDFDRTYEAAMQAAFDDKFVCAMMEEKDDDE